MEKLYILTERFPDEDIRLPSVPGSVISLEGPSGVTYGDVPAGISLIYPDLSVLSVLAADPSPSPEASRSFFACAERLASGFGGLVFKEDGGICKSFVDPVVLPDVSEYRKMIGLSVLFPADSGLRSRRREAVSLFEKRLPYLLPEKFGDRFPPDRDFFGLPGFLDFLDSCDYPVIYPRLPVSNLFFSEGGSRNGAPSSGVGSVSFFLPADVWDIPSWKFALCEVLAGLCGIYGAFFGRISADERPDGNPSWNGVPYELGCAALFGPPYFDLISGKEKGRITGDRSILFVEPDGPDVPDRLIAGKPRGFAKLFGKKSPAAEIPDGCFSKAEGR